MTDLISNSSKKDSINGKVRRFKNARSPKRAAASALENPKMLHETQEPESLVMYGSKERE